MNSQLIIALLAFMALPALAQTVPEVSQESIDTALERWDIKVPRRCTYPILDYNMADRGMVRPVKGESKRVVTIGQLAFVSWGILGSTLAHELEVHCKQNMYKFVLWHIFGVDLTNEYEREAYLHELKNAKRFGLTKRETEEILDTFNFYYGEKE